MLTYPLCTIGWFAKTEERKSLFARSYKNLVSLEPKMPFSNPSGFRMSVNMYNIVYFMTGCGYFLPFGLNSAVEADEKKEDNLIIYLGKG